MKWYKNLFLGQTIASEAHQIVKKINKRKPTPNVYVIALASNSENLMDLIPSWELLQPGYPKRELAIIGLANGKEEATEVATGIIKKVYESTGDFELREYLQGEWRTSGWKS